MLFAWRQIRFVFLNLAPSKDTLDRGLSRVELSIATAPGKAQTVARLPKLTLSSALTKRMRLSAAVLEGAHLSRGANESISRSRYVCPSLLTLIETIDE